MPGFGKESEAQLATCNPRLVRVLRKAILVMDFTVLEGHRDEKRQMAAFRANLSQLPWPQGNHNKLPSDAVDVAPYPIDWSNKQNAVERFVLLAGVMLACAHELGIRIRWGGDWNKNFDTRDENFRDYGHFEVIP